MKRAVSVAASSDVDILSLLANCCESGLGALACASVIRPSMVGTPRPAPTLARDILACSHDFTLVVPSSSMHGSDVSSLPVLRYSCSKGTKSNDLYAVSLT